MGNVVANRASYSRSGQGVMAGNVPANRAHGCSL